MNDETKVTEVEGTEVQEIELVESVEDATGVVAKDDSDDEADYDEETGEDDDEFDDEDEADLEDCEAVNNSNSEENRPPIQDHEIETEPVKLSELDLTVQTITLGTYDNPHVSLMKGHVDEKTFVRGFHAEGWGNDGTEYTDEQVEQDAKSEVGELKHVYGAPYVNEEKGSEGWREHSSFTYHFYFPSFS